MITYFEQLKDKRWKDKRRQILIRDNYTCQVCSNIDIVRFETEIYVTMTPNSTIVKCLSANLSSQKIPQFSFNLSFHNDLLMDIFGKIPKVFVVNYYFEENEKKPYIIRDISLSHLKMYYNMNKKIMVDYDPYENNIDDSDSEIFDYTKTILIDNPSYFPELVSLVNASEKKYVFGLNVHHKVYREKRLAWEYEDEDLITLCQSCHEAIHIKKKDQFIPWYDEENVQIGNRKICNRCGGTGYIMKYDYYLHGICFACNGNRFS